MKFIVKIITLILIFPAFIFGQNNNPLKEKNIFIENNIITIDSFSIIPNSLVIYKNDSVLIDKIQYEINEIESKIKIINPDLINKTLKFQYYIYPVLLSKNYYHRKLTFIEPDNNADTYWKKHNTTLENKSNSNLIKEGNISRRIMIGNSQDLSVISNIDLRLSGELGKDYKIQAVISDNNLPFQADGSSYKLQEFDNVYIRIFNNENEVITGDLELKNNSNFFRFQKKTKGLLLSNSRKINHWIYSNSSAISMSKGKYSSNYFEGIEGNQGPYKLNGKNGENYIVVLAGTEKVYIDGKRLNRGIDNDYVIDYNTAEITFTNKFLITKDKRINVEFEYSDKSYAQSILYSKQKFKSEKTQISFTLYSQQDWKNQNYLQELSDSDKKTLSENGDNIDDLLSNSADSVGFNNHQIRYEKIDTLLNNIPISFYKFSSNAEIAIYQIRFTEVQTNQGNYVEENQGLNGKTFKWIPPIVTNGEIFPQGNYTPKIRLISPKKINIAALNLESKISKKIKINTELVYSHKDDNLFSTLDDDDNSSFASFLELESVIIQNNKWSFINKSRIEYISAHFKGLDRFKDVEHNRNWNITNENISNEELISSILFSLTKQKKEVFNYQFQKMKKGTYFTGNKNSTILNWDYKNYFINTNTNFTTTNFDEINSNLLQSKSNIYRKLKYTTIGIENKQEKIHNLISDNKFNDLSMEFNEWSAFINHENNIFNIKLTQRDDKKASNLSLNNYSNSKQINANLNLIKNKNLKYNISTTYRTLSFLADSLQSESENSILSSNNISAKLIKDFISLNLRYELGKGKENKKEKNYIKVPDGMGTHSWIDYNNNDLEELNEFQLANFEDLANYVVLYLPSSKFENVYSLKYNHSVQLNPGGITENKLLQKLNFSNNFVVQNKNKSNSQFLNPFNNNMDSSITFSSLHQNSVYYNRSSKQFNILINNINRLNQNTFSYGTDNQIIKENNAVVNLGLSNSLTSFSKIIFGEKSNTSTFFQSKNYDYKYLQIEEEITFSKLKNTDIKFIYVYKKKESINLENELFSSHNLSINFKRKANDRNQIFGESKMVFIDYNGSSNPVLSYELLEGLNNGINFVWQINVKHTLKNNMILIVGYNGRKSENSETKHIGNMQIQSYF